MTFLLGFVPYRCYAPGQVQCCGVRLTRGNGGLLGDSEFGKILCRQGVTAVGYLLATYALWSGLGYGGVSPGTWICCGGVRGEIDLSILYLYDSALESDRTACAASAKRVHY